MYEIGTLFYSEITGEVGEIITKDNNKWIAKFYHQRKDATYGVAPVEHVIIGKSKIMQQLNDDVRCAEINLERIKNTLYSVPDYEKLRDKVKKIIQRNKDLMDEILNIQNNQIVQYSKNREKQIFCILKAIKRNNKMIKRLNRGYDANKDVIENWKNALQIRKEFLEFVKRI